MPSRKLQEKRTIGSGVPKMTKLKATKDWLLEDFQVKDVELRQKMPDALRLCVSKVEASGED